MTEYKQADIEMRSWKDGMKDAARILETYPEGFPKHFRWILNSKRLEILAAACSDEAKPTNPRRIGDGVTAQMQGDELCLSAQNGDGSEDVIIMCKETCDNLMRYIQQNVVCSEL